MSVAAAPLSTVLLHAGGATGAAAAAAGVGGVAGGASASVVSLAQNPHYIYQAPAGANASHWVFLHMATCLAQHVHDLQCCAHFQILFECSLAPRCYNSHHQMRPQH